MSPFLAPLMRDSAPQLLKPEVFRSFGGNVVDPMLSLLTKIDIEVVPLAFIRGRTFNNCFCILDEAQNCTINDLKLFLTRIGRGTKTVIEGDSTQSDRDNSGLVEVMQRLHGMEQVGIVQLNEVDIIRNPLISHILRRLNDD
jgi:phosphate starvation-inducible PhoH-like protein